MNLDPLSVLIGAALAIVAQWLLAAADIGRLLLLWSGRGRLADRIGSALLIVFLLAAAGVAVWWMADAIRLVASHLSRRF